MIQLQGCQTQTKLAGLSQVTLNQVEIWFFKWELRFNHVLTLTFKYKNYQTQVTLNQVEIWFFKWELRFNHVLTFKYKNYQNRCRRGMEHGFSMSNTDTITNRLCSFVVSFMDSIFYLFTVQNIVFQFFILRHQSIII